MMSTSELAIDENGEPFPVPPEVAGWRARRALDGRGRPVLVHAKGKPLIVGVNASHAELYAAAGPGRYRLEGVDESGHAVAGVPIACTGPLTADHDETNEFGSGGELALGGARPRPFAGYDDMLCQVVAANTRIMERTLDQLGTVMSGVAQLLNAAHNAGITSRVVPPPPPAPPAEIPTEDAYEEDASPSGMPEWLNVVIKQTVATAVPLIFAKLPSLSGLPLEALVDWRKAAPPPPAAPSAPAATPPSAPAATSPSAPPPSPAPAPVAPQPSAPEAVPAEPHAAPAASTPRTPEEANAMVSAHVTQVWHGLAPTEQARAAQLLAHLTREERAAWIAELASLTVPEALERVRGVIHAQPSTMPQVPTATPPGDPV